MVKPFLHPLCRAALQPTNADAWLPLNTNAGFLQAQEHGLHFQLSSFLSESDLNQFTHTDAIELTLLQQKNAEELVYRLGKVIPVVALKGFVLGRLIYGNPAYKPMNDLDVLIRKDDYVEASVELKRLGYVQLFKKAIDSAHHAPPWLSPDGTLLLSIHFDLYSAKKFAALPIDLIESAVAFNYQGKKFFRLQDTQFLLHLVIHLSLFSCGLKEAMDVVQVIKNFEIDWSIFEKYVCAVDAHHSVLHCDSLLRSYFGTSYFPENLLTIARTSSRYPWVKRYCEGRVRGAQKLAEKGEILPRSRFGSYIEEAILKHFVLPSSFLQKSLTATRLSWKFFVSRDVPRRHIVGAGLWRLFCSKIHESVFDHGRKTWIKMLVALYLRALRAKKSALLVTADDARLSGLLKKTGL